MTREVFIKTLRKFLNDNNHYPIYLIGTGNLMLQGIDVLPSDIDFIASKSVVIELANRYNTAPKENRSGYIECEFTIDGIEVHMVSNDNNPLRPGDLEGESIHIPIQGLCLKGLTLESERKAYTQMGREKDKNKVDLINAKIRINRAAAIT